MFEGLFLMPSNLQEWDEKHRTSAEHGLAEPATIVRELLPILPAGPVLDLACGTGRHALLMAQNHRVVTAVDFSGVALDILQQRAAALNISSIRTEKTLQTGSVRNERVIAVQIDLERVELPEKYFWVVICTQYLQRSLFPAIARTLRPGGMLIFETFTKGQLDLQGGPRNPAYLLEREELRTAFPELKTLFYRELLAEHAVASLLAQKTRRASAAR